MNRTHVRAYAPVLTLIAVAVIVAQFLGSGAARPILASLGVSAAAPGYTSLELVNFGALKPAVRPGDTRNFGIRIGNHEGTHQRYLLAGTVAAADGRVISRIPAVQVPVAAGTTAQSRIIATLPLCRGRIKVTAQLDGRAEKVHAWFALGGGRNRTPACEQA